mgnify:FL=1
MTSFACVSLPWAPRALPQSCSLEESTTHSWNSSAEDGARAELRIQRWVEEHDDLIQWVDSDNAEVHIVTTHGVRQQERVEPTATTALERVPAPMFPGVHPSCIGDRGRMMALSRPSRTDPLIRNLPLSIPTVRFRIRLSPQGVPTPVRQAALTPAVIQFTEAEIGSNGPISLRMVTRGGRSLGEFTVPVCQPR